MSKQDLDQAQTNYDAALADMKSVDAQINQEQVQLHYFRAFARVAGIVGDIPVHVGDRVTNTTVLTTIDERKGLEVYLQIPAGRAREVKMGAPVEILDAAGKGLLTTRIYFISPQVDTSTRSLLVKAPVDQAANKLRSQQLVKARIAWSTQVGDTIPVIAVSRMSGRFFAFVAENWDGKETGESGSIAGLSPENVVRRLIDSPPWLHHCLAAALLAPSGTSSGSWVRGISGQQERPWPPALRNCSRTAAVG